MVVVGLGLTEYPLFTAPVTSALVYELAKYTLGESLEDTEIPLLLTPASALGIYASRKTDSNR